MAYFLKKSKSKNRMYLQIYESFYDPKRGHTAHRSHKALGYVDILIDSGIPDPLSHFQKEVDALNQERNSKLNEKKTKLISDASPEKYLGYFAYTFYTDSVVFLY